MAEQNEYTVKSMNTPRAVSISRQSPITSVLWSIAAVILPLVCEAGGASAQLKVSQAEAIRLTAVDLGSIQRRHRLPGLSAAVRCDGALIWAGGFGEAAPGQPATPTTRYRIASVSKVLTAGAAAVLIGEGRLDVDRPVGETLTALPADWGAPTMRELLAHLGGVSHYRLWELENKPHFDDVEAATSVFVGRRIRPPGQRRYSSYGFVLASAAMQSAAGVDFLTLVQSTVLDPLGMHDTGPDEAGCRGCAVTHRRWPLIGPQPAAPVDLSYKWAAGGFSSTVLDLTTYGAAWLAPGFLDAATLTNALTPVPDGDGAPSANGLGWRLLRSPMTGKLSGFSHGGSVLGGGAALLVDPRTGVSVAILSNLRRRDAFTIGDARTIADRFADCRDIVAHDP
jgi:serine beta-lactamase-like protein LACTB